MAKEALPPASLGITTEHRTPSGIVLRFQPSSRAEKDWGSYGGPMTPLQGSEAAAGLFTTDFIEETLTLMHQKEILRNARDGFAMLITQGRKNAIYLINISGARFILVMSRGTEGLQREVEEEYANIGELRRSLQRERLPIFVPQAYVLSHGETVSGFSFELLPNHYELHATGLKTSERYYTTFQLFSEAPKAAVYNERVARMAFSQVALPTANHSDKDPNYRIKRELVSRLVLVWWATGGRVPKEFLVNAGDFMVDPRNPDFDPQLITVRGGWKELAREEFVRWLYECQFAQPTMEEFAMRLEHPLFDYDSIIIQKGAEIAEKIRRKTSTSLPSF